MLLQEKLLHRALPTSHRYKVEFESDNAASVIPPLYVFFNNASGWDIDTFWMLPALRAKIAAMFESLYTTYFEDLTVEKIIEAAENPDAIYMQYVQLDRDDDGHSSIRVKYYDLEATYPIPGKQISVKKIRCEDILDDITGR